MSTCRVLLFEDHGEDWLDLFDLLILRSQSPLMEIVVESAASILRKEIGFNEDFSQKVYPDFTTLKELRDKISQDPSSCPLALRSAIVCLSQIGLLVDHLHKPEAQLLNLKWLPLGFGIGTIAAAVAAYSRNTNEILSIYPYAISLSFKVGALAQKTLKSLYGHHQKVNSAWVSLQINLSEGELTDQIRDFNKQYVLSHQKCHATLVSESYSVVSGPLITMEAFKNAFGLITDLIPSIPLNIPDMYLESDVSALIFPAEICHTSQSFEYLSTATGEVLEFASGCEALNHVARECVTKLGNLTLTSTAVAKSTDGKYCTVSILKQSRLGQHLQTGLQAQLNAEVTLNELVPVSADTTGIVPRKSTIAIVGMAGRFPGADDIEELWDLLHEGKDVHRTIPADRFNHETHSDSIGEKPNTSKTPYGCFIEQPGLFDARFFDMSPKEAMQTDPAQRLMILTAYEALEMAGFVPNRTPSTRADRVATFYGQASDDWREVNSSQNIDTYFIPGGIRAFGPGRINYHFKFSGPSFSVDTACSSSFAAIHAACNSLWLNNCDTALAGGANILTNPDIFAGLSRGHFLSSTGSCKTFDEDADGYCRADGVASVILKRLEDAENDHDNILGLITAIGTNHSADAVSITHPHAPTQSKLYRSLLSNSGTDPHNVDLVEMHGTGTQAGDYNESQSVSDVFAPRDRHLRDRPLFIGSVKANLGHAEAAAGITSLIKAVQMLRHGVILPHVGVKGRLNPELPQDLTERKVVIPFKPQEWKPKSDGTPRTAFLNNFSAAGGNTGLILQEHLPKVSNELLDRRSYHILTVSARTIKSMQASLKRLAAFTERYPQTELAHLSYTLTARRMAHSYRKSFVVSDIFQVAEALTSCMDDQFEPAPSHHFGAVFAFTGQGSVYTSLAKTLFETLPDFNRRILNYDHIAQCAGFPSFLELINGSAEDITSLQPTVLQVGQVCIQLALARLWISWGIEPKAVIGHSLGESSCSVAGEKMYTKTHEMVAVLANMDTIKAKIKGTSIEVSCINAPETIVLGGSVEALDDCLKKFSNTGTRCTKIPVAYAFHTSQVEPIVNEFMTEADKITFSRPQIPILSPLLGKTIDADTPDVFTAKYLCRQARECVDFNSAISSFVDFPEWNDKSTWLEVGPHPTCTKFAQQILGKTTPVANSLHRDSDPWKTLLESAGTFYEKGFTVQWGKVHHDYEGSHRLIDLPAYPWDLKKFWIDYVGDWCLSKGALSSQEHSNEIQSRIHSSSIHSVLKEEFHEAGANVLFESDFSDPILFKKAQGHKVNGTPLCPSSLYAEMAMTIAKYIYKNLNHNQTLPEIDVCDMAVDKPFIVEEAAKLRIAASATEKVVNLEFYSVQEEDHAHKTVHATCEVRYGDEELWTSKWSKTMYLIKDRIAMLEKYVLDGSAHKIQKALVYRLFANFVDYDEEFQGIQDIILDSKQFEAAANVYTNPSESGALFSIPPTWIDSLCHLTGVILNASDAVDSKFVYISHGWKSLRLLSKLGPDSTYRTYVRMQETESDIMEGDVWIFDSQEEVVGLAKGIKFSKIPRRTIDALLPHSNSSHLTKTETSKDKPSTNSEQRQPKDDETTHPAQENSLTAQNQSTEAPSTSTIDGVLSIIATECTVETSELVDGCTLKSLGIDSLLSLEILTKLRESFGLDLRPQVFIDNETIGELKSHLEELTGDMSTGNDPQDSPPTSTNNIETSAGPMTPSTASNGTSSTLESESDHSSASTRHSSMDGRTTSPNLNYPRATSYLLSGNAKTAKKYLFLFPDGSGSATSYANLPSFDHDICVYAMNSPFMTQPDSWTGGISPIIDLYLSEIRRRKPQGTYSVAGWSAGGILAYEAALQLCNQGEVVENMILIDSPCPVSLPPMPIKMFEFLDSIGLLGSSNNNPDWLIPHFDATVKNLDGYEPTPFKKANAPTTTMIWARQGVTSETGGRRPPREDGDPAVMDWLLDDRTEFDGNGWEALIPKDLIKAETMEGHHFNMTNEHVNELGRLMVKAML